MEKEENSEDATGKANCCQKERIYIVIINFGHYFWPSFLDDPNTSS
jgi:hypothetical protein